MLRSASATGQREIHIRTFVVGVVRVIQIFSRIGHRAILLPPQVSMQRAQRQTCFRISLHSQLDGTSPTSTAESAEKCQPPSPVNTVVNQTQPNGARKKVATEVRIATRTAKVLSSLRGGAVADRCTRDSIERDAAPCHIRRPPLQLCFSATVVVVVIRSTCERAE
jgi:hypothetical protein